MIMLSNRPRYAVLIGLLTAVCAVWAFAVADAFVGDRELEKVAQSRIQECRDFVKKYPRSAIATDITTAHEYLLFGDRTGKVRIYTKYREFDGRNIYSVIDYFYEERGDRWVQTESASLPSTYLKQAKRAFGDEL
ncbi:MAG: hypothetical protein K1Y02_10905 [Candidatus Hydrogenedentes bacterium]|nr:hypothetical protein [Candidatus Hydrogenedentota bacterium]